MRNFRIFTWLVLLGCFTSYVTAQTKRGTVYDKSTGQPVTGANVITGNNQQGATTDSAGNFSLDVKGAKTLTISSVGYSPFVVSRSGNEF